MRYAHSSNPNLPETNMDISTRNTDYVYICNLLGFLEYEQHFLSLGRKLGH